MELEEEPVTENEENGGVKDYESEPGKVIEVESEIISLTDDGRDLKPLRRSDPSSDEEVAKIEKLLN